MNKTHGWRITAYFNDPAIGAKSWRIAWTDFGPNEKETAEAQAKVMREAADARSTFVVEPIPSNPN